MSNVVRLLNFYSGIIMLLHRFMVILGCFVIMASSIHDFGFYKIWNYRQGLFSRSPCMMLSSFLRFWEFNTFNLEFYIYVAIVSFPEARYLVDLHGRSFLFIVLFFARVPLGLERQRVFSPLLMSFWVKILRKLF